MMKVRSISIPDVLWGKLKAVAESKGISISDVIRRASEEYVDGKEVGCRIEDRA